MKRRFPITLVMVVLLTTLLVGPVSAIDTAHCNDLYQNRWSGEKVDGAKHGASGTLDAQALNQCTSPGLVEISGSFAFSNVERQGSANSIVQIGIGRCRKPGINGCDSTMRNYWAWGRDSSAPGCSGFASRGPEPELVSNWSGAAADYKVYHKTDRWRFYIGLTEVKSISEASICWTATAASWFGESWDVGDAIGGTAANKFRISSTNYANAENGGFFWTGFNSAAACNINSGAPYFCDIVNATTIDIWTNR
jgi:hypothetical protein